VVCCTSASPSNTTSGYNNNTKKPLPTQYHFLRDFFLFKINSISTYNRTNKEKHQQENKYINTNKNNNNNKKKKNTCKTHKTKRTRSKQKTIKT